MTGTASKRPELAAWQSLIARPDATRLLAAAALYLLSATVIPFVTNESVALLFTLICACFFYTQTRTLISLVAPAVPAFLLFSVSGTMLLPAAFFAIVFGGACGAILLIGAKDPKRDVILILLPVAAFLAAFFLRGDAVNALLTLLPLPVAIAAALAVRRCTPFTASVAALTATVAAGLLVAGGVTLFLFDMLDLALLPAFLEALANGLIDLLHENAALYAEAGLTLEITPTDIRNMLAELTNLAPALFTLTAMVTAYFTWRTLSVLLVSFGALPRMPRLLVTPTMSVTAALIFLIAQLTTLVANAETATVAGAVAQNLTLILAPGLALVGARQLTRRDQPRSCLSVLLLFAIVYLVFSSPAAALAVTALLGAVHVLIDAFGNAKNKKGEL